MDRLALLTTSVSSLIVLASVAVAARRSGPLWDDAARFQVKRLATRSEALGLNQDRLRIGLRVWGVAVPGVFLAIWLVLGSLAVAAVIAVGVYAAPHYVLDFCVRRRSRLLRDQVVSAARALANAVRSGMNLHQGLELLAHDTVDPLGAEFRRIVADYSRGRPLRDALEMVRRRLELEPFTLFAAAIEVSLEHGGRVNEALSRICHALVENQRLERKMEADTASGRRSVLVLASFPLLFLGMMTMLDVRLVRVLFMSFWGQVAVCAVVLLVFAGAAWAHRLVTVRV